MPAVEELKQVIKDGLAEVEQRLLDKTVEKALEEISKRFDEMDERLKKIEEMPLGKVYISKRGISGKYRGYDLEEQGREFREKGIGIFGDDEQAEEYAKFLIDFVRAAGPMVDMDAVASLKEFYKKKGLEEGVAASGGYLVPEEYVKTLVEIAKDESFALNLCTVINMGSNSLKLPKEVNSASVVWIDEGETISSSDPSFGQVVLNAKKLGGLSEVTNEALQDSAVDIVGILTRQWATGIGVELDNQVLNGNGSPFTGVLSGAGNTVTMDSGKTNFSDITADYLADMEAEIESKYAKNLRYILHRKVFNYVRKLKDNNGDYIVTRPAGNMPGTIWEIPYLKSDVAPSASGANKPFVVLGNFKYVYIGRRKGVGVIDRDPYGKFDADITRFRIVTRWAVAIARPEAFCRLVTAAS